MKSAGKAVFLTLRMRESGWRIGGGECGVGDNTYWLVGGFPFRAGPGRD